MPLSLKQSASERPERSASGFHPASLDALNLLLADVRATLGRLSSRFQLPLITNAPAGAAPAATMQPRGWSPQGIGASFSGFVAGFIVDNAGYSKAFLSLGPAAAIALTVSVMAMPKTAPSYTTAAGLARAKPAPG